MTSQKKSPAAQGSLGATRRESWQSGGDCFRRKQRALRRPRDSPTSGIGSAGGAGAHSARPRGHTHRGMRSRELMGKAPQPISPKLSRLRHHARGTGCHPQHARIAGANSHLHRQWKFHHPHHTLRAKTQIRVRWHELSFFGLSRFVYCRPWLSWFGGHWNEVLGRDFAARLAFDRTDVRPCWARFSRYPAMHSHVRNADERGKGLLRDFFSGKVI